GDEGTGLGLAMVQGAAERHGGEVTLDTAPGAGATFTLWFPEGGPPPSLPPSRG
ncbi:MAG: HAMP domain-containing histidine kinase, partial [Myxococcales bacterium]|nr:HAMP domain-containing histidine kinase [Myxococcales bacterium]